MDAYKPDKLLHRNLLITRCVFAAMLIALLLCLSLVSPSVYADKKCLVRFCPEFAGTISPDSMKEMGSRPEFINTCMQEPAVRALCSISTIKNGGDDSKVPREVKYKNLWISQDAAKTLQKLETLNDRFNNPGASQNKKIVTPGKKPRQGVDNTNRVTRLYTSQIQEDIKNSDGFFSASVAYLKYLGVPIVAGVGLVQDGVVYYTPELEFTRDAAFTGASVLSGVGAINAIRVAGGVKAIPSLIREEYKNIASIFGKNVDDVGRGVDNLADFAHNYQRSVGAVQRIHKVLQTGGNKLNKKTANTLNNQLGENLKPREWGRALETLKNDLGLPGNHHARIVDNGDYIDDAGNILGNLLDYVP